MNESSIPQTPDALCTFWTHRCDICGMTNEGDLPLTGWSVYRGLLVHDETCRAAADRIAEEVG